MLLIKFCLQMLTLSLSLNWFITKFVGTVVRNGAQAYHQMLPMEISSALITNPTKSGFISAQLTNQSNRCNSQHYNQDLDDKNFRNSTNSDADVMAPKQNQLDGDMKSKPITAAQGTLSMYEFLVKLHQPIASNERVGLIGDTTALGSWLLDKCVVLNKSENNDLMWSTKVMVPQCSTLSYRYFIFIETYDGEKCIRRWESHLRPRVKNLSIINESSMQIDYFGQQENDKEIYTHMGWITRETIIQLKFERKKMFQISDLQEIDPSNSSILLKLVALNNSRKFDINTQQYNDPNAVSIDVAKMEYGKSQLRPQPTTGIDYKEGDTVIFHVTVISFDELSFELLLYTSGCKFLGHAVIPSSLLKGSEGELQLNIVGQSKNVIANLQLPYLVVKPYPSVSIFNFRNAYAHYWPKSWTNLDVGHRGNGKSFIYNPPKERENTISSFLKAYESLVDMVELDVHLTADGLPVIYHDFGIRTAASGVHVTTIDQLNYVLIKNLRYEDLKSLRVFTIIGKHIQEYPSHNAEPSINQRMFPTLSDIFDALPKSLGIDVEIKWPQLTLNGTVEAEQTLDKNYFVDRILEVVIEKAKDRLIVFSSFDADICTMLGLKQNRFPVMFLTMGETQKWQPFLNLRTRTFEQAINNAQAFELIGTAPHAEDFLGSNGARLMQKALALNQIVLVWGDDCNSKAAVQYFRTIGATAICYDRADLYVPESKRRPFFNSNQLMMHFTEQTIHELP